MQCDGNDRGDGQSDEKISETVLPGMHQPDHGQMR
jgi:hypothetical protein